MPKNPQAVIVRNSRKTNKNRGVFYTKKALNYLKAFFVSNMNWLVIQHQWHYQHQEFLVFPLL